MSRFEVLPLTAALAAGALILVSAEAAPTSVGRDPDEASKVAQWLKTDQWERGPSDARGNDEDEGDDGASASDASICPLCHLDYSQRTGLPTKCGHKFHEIRIESWMEGVSAFERGCRMCSERVVFESGETVSQFLKRHRKEFQLSLKKMWGSFASFDEALY